MSEEPPRLFDPGNPPPPSPAELERGRRLADDGIDRAGRHVDPAWKAEAARAIRDLVAVRVELVADDVWRLLDERRVGYPPEPRAMGAAIRAAQRAGLISPTDRWAPTARATAHASPQRVWRAHPDALGSLE